MQVCCVRQCTDPYVLCGACDASFGFAVTDNHALIDTGICFDTRLGSHTDIEHDKLCITGYHKLGKLGGAATKAALIESEGYMFNEHDKLCITGYHKLGKLGGKLGGAATKAALIESEGYMFNEHDKLYHERAKLGGAGLAQICAADALGEHHTHICISALCQRGASVMWEKGYPVVVHLCYDPQQSGLAGQRLRQKKGLKLHVCKKCHRTAKDCKGGASCRAPAA